jgi:hypothetical protein
MVDQGQDKDVDPPAGLPSLLETLINLILFLTILDCFVYITSKTIQESGLSDELGFKINSGQSGALESCERNSRSARAYDADAC